MRIVSLLIERGWNMIVGSFGEFVFKAAEESGAVTMQTIDFSRSERLQSHATVQGLPVVDFLGVDSSDVTLQGVIHSEFSGALDDCMNSLLALQDGKPRALTRGTYCYGIFHIKSLTFNVSAWCGTEPAALSWKMQLVSTRG